MKTITLALQGGGTHGAFTWGVLDRLLADERIAIEAISGTSAGAINGALLACGMSEGGRDGARRLLRRFWWHLADVSRLSPLQPTPLDRALSGWGVQYSPVYQWVEAVTRLLSPYHLNPLGIDPLRAMLRSVIDFERLATSPVRLFVSATDVRSGKVRVFLPDEVTEDVVLASSCLPNLTRAVEIDGRAYWDGGYVANPAIHPLVHRAAATEVVIVQVNPIGGRPMPVLAEDILHRINEISFNASVMREMHALAYLTRLDDAGWIAPEAKVRRTHIHMIADEELMAGLHASSKFNAEPAFIDLLFDAGTQAAGSWLAAHYDDLGRTSTIDINEVYL
ncbi:patatin-like phospholipase family protein [Magnetospirillum sp. UT-4]|uniref:patatin-like phospholipase family protein n=1 Tax=Magnetospirillum sp. UT-4 TaxID=2681467 RepID=UPI0013833DE1|nr:patatin-like phospholipase family protein [Magnetospirillum sp. UT-4]CAA7626308.1 Patatin [Magnetospirillum sp. UT-4]